jgi:hypothetical protein
MRLTVTVLCLAASSAFAQVVGDTKGNPSGGPDDRNFVCRLTGWLCPPTNLHQPVPPRSMTPGSPPPAGGQRLPPPGGGQAK